MDNPVLIDWECPVCHMPCGTTPNACAPAHRCDPEHGGAWTRFTRTQPRKRAAE